MGIEWPSKTTDVLKEDPLVIKNQKDWYHIHAYGGWGKFFKGLQQENEQMKLLIAELSLKNRVLKKSLRGLGDETWND